VFSRFPILIPPESGAVIDNAAEFVDVECDIRRLRISLDKDGSIGRCDAFDLFEHRLQGPTIAYDLPGAADVAWRAAAVSTHVDRDARRYLLRGFPGCSMVVPSKIPNVNCDRWTEQFGRSCQCFCFTWLYDRPLVQFVAAS
jgi:hypothetical protein